jgi:hypothetical protein
MYVSYVDGERVEIGLGLLCLVHLARRSMQGAAAALAWGWFVGAVLAISAVRRRSFNEATVPNPNGRQTFVWPHLLQWHNLNIQNMSLRTRGPETLHRTDSKHSIDDTLDTTPLTPSPHELPGQVSQITSQRDTVPHQNSCSP